VSSKQQEFKLESVLTFISLRKRNILKSDAFGFKGRRAPGADLGRLKPRSQKKKPPSGNWGALEALNQLA